MIYWYDLILGAYATMHNNAIEYHIIYNLLVTGVQFNYVGRFTKKTNCNFIDIILLLRNSTGENLIIASTFTLKTFITLKKKKEEFIRDITPRLYCYFP